MDHVWVPVPEYPGEEACSVCHVMKALSGGTNECTGEPPED